VQTVDFFTPVVDDPFTFGAVAAANSLSDIYAMGATPLFALNIVAFPVNDLPLEIMNRILKGGSAKAHQAGIQIVGGHSIEDKEPKYGLVVTGLVAPDKVVSNAGAKPGDALLLTKPIGTGIISTALKGGQAGEDLLARAVEVMTALNRAASEAMLKMGVNACTDITGFGLLGHLYEVVQGSGVGAVLRMGDVPLIEGVRDLARQGIVPGGTRRNLDHLNELVDWPEGITGEDKLILCDAQTSGGLLISLPGESARALSDELNRKKGLQAAVIGDIVESGEEGKPITVIK
jgi:selenide,water dikinase